VLSQHAMPPPPATHDQQPLRQQFAAQTLRVNDARAFSGPAQLCGKPLDTDVYVQGQTETVDTVDSNATIAVFLRVKLAYRQLRLVHGEHWRVQSVHAAGGLVADAQEGEDCRHFVCRQHTLHTSAGGAKSRTLI
jgi:hypothetical protein